MFYETHETDLGWLTAHSDGSFLTRLQWSAADQDDTTHADDVSRETWRQIEEYFAGKRRDFDLPLKPDSSPAQRKWLDVMQKINYGETKTYSEFAAMWGNVAASRAAGQACSHNPIILIIPCHRVLQKNGNLGNYGARKDIAANDPKNLAIKRALLDLENRHCPT